VTAGDLGLGKSIDESPASIKRIRRIVVWIASQDHSFACEEQLLQLRSGFDPGGQICLQDASRVRSESGHDGSADKSRVSPIGCAHG